MDRLDRFLNRLAGCGVYFMLLALILLVGALLGLLFDLIIVGPRHEAIARYEAHCAAAGGHIYKPDDTGFCVRDGLWVEVYP